MRALISSSATGGHIYPALAIADEIMLRDSAAEVLFVSAKWERWEVGTDIVGSAGYRQAFVDVLGFDRKNLFANIGVLIGLVRASGEIKKILKEFKPDVCIGTGGHISGLVIRAAKKAGIRTVIEEQNVIPGMANKLAEKYADRVFVGFKEAVQYFKNPDKIIVSGNPVRTAFAEAAARRAEIRERLGINDKTFCVLFVGGSQGADAINMAAACTVRELGGHEGYHFIVITGGRDFNVRQSGAALLSGVVVIKYADAIYELYAAADLIVARAGALTVAEIAESGKASVLIPSPNVTNNHQYFNAKALSDGGAAVLIPEEELGGLSGEIKRLAADSAALEAIGRAAKAAAMPEAARVIVDEILGS